MRLRAIWVSLAVAAAIASPFAMWQHAHGWPGVDFFLASRAAARGRTGPVAVFLDQLRLLGPFSCAAAALGIVRALRGSARIAGLPFLFALVAVAVVGGKPYYASSAAPLAIAAGAVAVVDRVRTWPRLAAAALSAAALIQCLGTLPLLPRSPLLASLHPELVQFTDWRSLARSVSELHSRVGLDPSAPVLTDSYGTAAALAHFGGPPVLSGSNSFAAWAWPRRDEPDAVLAIGYPPDLLRRFFAHVDTAGRVEARSGGNNRFDFPKDAWVCTGRTASLRAAWHLFIHYD
jgi:hypothetical protein